MATDFRILTTEKCAYWFLIILLVSADSKISFVDDCQWNYNITNGYSGSIGSVTIDVADKGCEVGSIRGFDKQPFDVSLRVREDNNSRQLFFQWDYNSCYSATYMQFEANFPPFLRKTDARKCILVDASRVNKSVTLLDEPKLEFNCLRVPGNVVGTLTVRITRLAASGDSCEPQGDYHTQRFNIGCPNDKVKIRPINECLGLEFSNLHQNIDYHRTTIELNGEHTFSGTAIKKFNSVSVGILDLPVYKTGIYFVQVKVVCDAFGEVKTRIIDLETKVADLTACPSYGSAEASSYSTTAPSLPTRVQILPVILVVSIVGMLSFTVTIVFFIRRSAGDCCPCLPKKTRQESLSRANDSNRDMPERVPFTDEIPTARM